MAEKSKDNNTRVAFMYVALGDIHNEPIWRAFFEAAGMSHHLKPSNHIAIFQGRLEFRYEFPPLPDMDFTEGEGREQFDRIKNEVLPCYMIDPYPD